MAFKEKIKEYIKVNGPVLPVQVAKHINTNILMASAYLSDMVSNKELKMSYLKVGGSPLYYLPGQEYKLQNYIKYLHVREQEAVALLREKQLLRDKDLPPAIRVALRNTKDFAQPINVTQNNTTELFWKWYLTPLTEIEQKIKTIFGEVKEKKIEKKQMPKERHAPEDFLKKVIDFFIKNDIKVIEKQIIRKNTEVDFIIKIPTKIGLLNYYCKAKNKKKITEADLSKIFITGQAKKLPILFLTTGILTKKAKELAENVFKGMHIKNI